MKIMLIANPYAGGFKKVSIEKIKEYLSLRNADVSVFLTGKAGDAREYASKIQEGEYDVVVAAGGDGTLNEVINGIAERAVTLGVIPAGTVNVFALETDIPLDPLKACDIILKNNVIKVNLGQADSRYFILMASAGFDAYVAYKIHTGLKSVFGKLAYVLHGIYLLTFYHFPKITVTANGKEYHGYTVIVSNMKMYAGKIQITPNASFFNDDFEICILTKKGIISIFKFLFYIIFKKQRAFKALTFLTADELTMKSASSCKMQVDGDGIKTLPKNIKIVKGALDVIVPE